MSQEAEKTVEVGTDNTILNSQLEEKHDQNLDTTRSSQQTSREASIHVEPAKAPYNPWADPASFPDGGARAWLTVAGAAACFFVSWG